MLLRLRMMNIISIIAIITILGIIITIIIIMFIIIITTLNNIIIVAQTSVRPPHCLDLGTVLFTRVGGNCEQGPRNTVCKEGRVVAICYVRGSGPGRAFQSNWQGLKASL